MFGRGIEVYKRWYSFEAFLSDMGEKPHKLILARIDKTRGYFPDNCHWATRLLPTGRNDLTKQIFNRLTVLGISHRHRKSARTTVIYWKCHCVCGAETSVSTSDLRSGNTQSCGCLLIDTIRQLNRTHGHTSNGWTPTYRSWSGMFTRCYNANSKSFQGYGSRGITVCERWNSFENFLIDMGERPESLSLDRINNDGNYEPTNCRWATASTQNKNRRQWDRKAAAHKHITISPE